MSEQPFVSVVTPFYNTADYLRECVESVLAQTHANFEYLLVDNQSTDGSAEIAAEYAKLDPRIRVIRNAEFVGQVPNYNGALRHVSPDARYVKIVQADDYIFPECLERMVAVGESNPTAAIIGSCYLEGRYVCGSGIEFPTECIPGRVAIRLHLLENFFLFGTPTNLMYRADVVAARQPFFSESVMHEDTELCYEVLEEADFGFVHQVLTMNRRGNGGILTSLQPFHWYPVFWYTTLRKFGSRFLSEQELPDRVGPARSEYLRILGESVVLRREPEFWDYHRRALANVGEKLPSALALSPQIARAAVKAALKPKWFLKQRGEFQHRARAQHNGSSQSRRDS
ncbi:MAG TPA: glycosyltransferase family 2 protein [Gemmatimonadaceae bacterium]|nr:glycosyltransferase family 2 protein [Gemmatimonadaceae bacterium]